MSRPSFKLPARILHWLMAAMVLAMLYVGAGMVASLDLRPTLLALHRPIGVTILVLVVVRLAYRLRNPPPSLPADLPRWQAHAATASHWLLYGLLFAMPLIGWSMLSAGAYPIVLWGGLQLPSIMPHSPTLYTILRTAHTWLAMLLFAAILLHIAAALFHAWVRRDGVFSAMTRGGTASDAPIDAASSRVSPPGS